MSNPINLSFSFQEVQNLIHQKQYISRPFHKLKAIKGAFNDLQVKTLCREKVILIAGTNGKGTVAKVLQTLLTASGKRVGLFTSPHLISICERIQIDGEPISEDLFVKCFSSVFEFYKKWQLSHSEILTLMASELFFKGRLIEPVEYAIFEVGIGGLWDCTNVIPHKVSVITQISYDHQHLLGWSLEEIAEQKLGIIHGENPQVIASSVFNQYPKLQLLKNQTIAHTKATWHEADHYTHQTQTVHGQPRTFITIYDQKQEMSLLGKRAAENASLALKAYEVLGFHPQKYLQSLKEVRWEGRMHKEYVTFCKCPVYFSGDHNEQGIESLINILKDFSYKEIYFLLSISETKDPLVILSHLLKVKNHHIYLTTAEFKGRKKEGYSQWLDQVTDYIEDPKQAIHAICKPCQKEDLVVVTGSLYLVGQLMAYIRKSLPL